MQTVHTVSQVREYVRGWHQKGQSVGFVPTMGNLHDGHISLIKEARARCDVVVVSIFVNPTQFGPNEDFDRYPRTLDADAAALVDAGTDLLFAPSVDEMYPLGQNQTWVDVDGLGEHLCGASRKGHFRGVTTVVSKLFNIVQPDVAVFGEKDFQQLAILRRMSEELLFPIKIVGATTSRESDGLARSSRNGFLDESERTLAPKLYQTLQQLKADIEAGEQDYQGLQSRYRDSLEQAGFQVDYLTVANARSLAPASADDTDLVVAVAAKLGNTRLIDNVSLAVVRDR